MNQFVNIPVLASNGTGAPVDVSKMGATKTIVVGGVAGGTTVTIEYSEDPAGAGPWAPLPNGSFQNPGRVTFDFAAHWIRAVTKSYSAGTPNADCGASGAGSSFVEVTAAPVDISTLPALKSVVSSGPVIVEVSEDGISWSQAFAFQNAGGQTQRVYGQFARVTGGAPVWMGGANEESASGFQPLIPFGTELRIYARSTGSDTSGNGTLANPYRTLRRAVLDIPQVITPNLWVIVDITGIGIEALPADFVIPPYVAAGTLDFDFAGEFFFWRAPVNIQADPELVPMTPLTDATIAAPGDITVTTDPQTGRITLTLTGAPRADWGGNALKGKIVVGAGGAFEGARVVQSDTTFIVLSRTDGKPGSSGMITTPIRIMQETATLQPANGNGLFRGGVLLAGITTMVFGGIVFLQPPDMFLPGLEIINCDDVVTQLCTVYAIDAQGGRVFSRNQTSYFPATTWGGTFVDVNFFGMRQCLYEEVGGLFFGSSGGDFFNVENTILGTGVITSARAWDPGGMGASLLNRLTNMDGLGAHDFGLNMGGGQAAGIDCRMDNYTGSAVKIANGAGFVDLIGVVGTGNGVGVIADNGSQIRADATTNNPATGLLGTAGADYQAGSLAPAAWPGIAFNTPDPATFARVYGV